MEEYQNEKNGLGDAEKKRETRPLNRNKTIQQHHHKLNDGKTSRTNCVHNTYISVCIFFLFSISNADSTD